MATNKKRVLDRVREAGVLRARELVAHGLPRRTLSRLVKQGELSRISRGLYVLPDSDVTEHVSLVEACKRVPNGVVCLISALSFHELTTQMPHEVWLAIDVNAWKPKVNHPALRIIRFSGRALNYGVQTHQVGGATVRVTTPAKVVADCFKYRNKVGVDVAVEALRDFRRKRLGTMDDLWKAAEVCRVARVMRPYMESVV